MSRVRILHLPRDCTEEQLRRHIIFSLPPSAPHIEITDCVIKRSDPNRGGNGVIRMAFMGFRTAASGQFVVRHFNGTYFGSAKLRVEVAKGLGEVGITTNMKKKMEASQQHEQLSKEGGKGGDNNNNNVSGAVKRSRDAAQGDLTTTTTTTTTTKRRSDEKEKDNDDDEEKNAQARRRKERLDEFITERTKATSGPTWASEVLLPESANVNIDPTGDTMLGTNQLSKEEEEQKEQEELEDPEEAERRALERQQALGEVSDMDFLASLTNKNDSTNQDMKHTEGKEGEKDEKSKEEEENEEKEQQQQQQQRCPLTSSSVVDEQEAIVYESRRVRIGNIPFIATEDDVKQFASSLVGPVESVHIPLTRDTRQSKGAAFVKFHRVDDAIRALTLCRGAVFMGRLLRVSAAEDDPYTKKLEEGHSGSGGMGLAGSSEFKRQKEQKQRHNENGGAMAWSSTYMSSHAAVETVAKRIGVTANSVVSVEARGAAVRAAIAEAYLTTEIQRVLGDEGIDFGLLENAQQNLLKTRSNTTILVKNIPAATTGDDAAELTKMFLRYGALETTAFPSAGTFALFRYVHQQDARVAFQRLSYKLFKNSPLFLEWAPIGAITDDTDSNDEDDNKNNNNNDADEDLPSGKAAFAPVLTLFITNIPFTSQKEEFYTFMLDACPRLAKAPEKHVERLAFEKDKGRAFLTLREQSTFKYVLQRLNGKNFAGRTLACVACKHTAAALAAKTTSLPSLSGTKSTVNEDEEDVAKVTAVIARRGTANTNTSSSHGIHVPAGCDPLKLVVKNVPFEATERDIRDLFSAFSEVRSVRLPRKSHRFSTHRENNHRGFAFVEFLSEEEAKRAMETLKATHLYGRHLVLQYAKLDER
ncbi:RNA recognition motif domain [Trypanosoma melophagium]|uniref:RNA recognition motif domain n=1 Tax=Trypanosoma melophagium TaxID=715481 RepID=UPI00351AA8FB|nr:RNA recognition motif domain [Trypanosoma melophagium]